MQLYRQSVRTSIGLVSQAVSSVGRWWGGLLQRYDTLLLFFIVAAGISCQSDAAATADRVAVGCFTSTDIPQEIIAPLQLDILQFDVSRHAVMPERDIIILWFDIISIINIIIDIINIISIISTSISSACIVDTVSHSNI